VKEIPGTCLETHKCLHEGARGGAGHPYGGAWARVKWRESGNESEWRQSAKEGEGASWPTKARALVGRRRPGALVGEQSLADYCVDTPVAIDHLRHAKIHRHRNQRNRLVFR